jgi:hypothetical protein
VWKGERFSNLALTKLGQLKNSCSEFRGHPIVCATYGNKKLTPASDTAAKFTTQQEHNDTDEFQNSDRVPVSFHSWDFSINSARCDKHSNY